MEAGTRVADSGDCGHVRAVRLDDGRVRVLCRTPSGILSYISDDEGLTLTREGNGFLIANAQVGAARLSTGGAVRTRDGRWRLYFSEDFVATGGSPAPMRIFSATSSDLLNWSVEPGVRIGAGATAGGTANHPSAINNPDGSVSVFYTRHGQVAQDPALAVWMATSADGLAFTSDVSTGLVGADVDAVAGGSGVRLYYNVGSASGGTIFSATGPFATVSALMNGFAPLSIGPPLRGPDRRDRGSAPVPTLARGR
jgi:hypothetical protein